MDVVYALKRQGRTLYGFGVKVLSGSFFFLFVLVVIIAVKQFCNPILL